MKRSIGLLTAVFLVLGATTGVVQAANIFAYYAFDGETSGVTPDGVGSHDLTLGKVSGEPGDSAAITGGGMFSNAATSTCVAGYAKRADGDAAFDTTYTKLSVSLWAKTSSWADTSFDNRYLTGKYSTGDNRGWNMNVVGKDVTVNQITFGGYKTAIKDEGSQWVTTSFTSALDAGVYHHIVGTFDASGQMRLYVDGMLAASATSTITQLNGDNINDFDVLNRGDSAYSETSGGGFTGSIDDYLIATGDVLTDQEVALLHGLGRLAGVAYGSGTTIGGDLADVLNAYQMQGSADAGGVTWQYAADVGGGTTVGAIGGSLAGGDAYIVLGTDGSGVMIPEPATMGLLTLGGLGMLIRRKR